MNTSSQFTQTGAQLDSGRQVWPGNDGWAYWVEWTGLDIIFFSGFGDRRGSSLVVDNVDRVALTSMEFASREACPEMIQLHCAANWRGCVKRLRNEACLLRAGKCKLK